MHHAQILDCRSQHLRIYKMNITLMGIVKAKMPGPIYRPREWKIRYRKDSPLHAVSRAEAYPSARTQWSHFCCYMYSTKN